MDRRRFLKGSALTGAALLGLEPSESAQAPQVPTLQGSAAAPPNILTIIVDQLRPPMWSLGAAQLDALLPNMARLRSGAVSFGRHFCAATASTPSRASMVTGLYTHQTGCMLTIFRDTPSLEPGFPTWGTLLRDVGYRTNWFGKWHLSTSCDLDQYGFSGGTCPSPNGQWGEGKTADPLIADQFVGWLARDGSVEPWATTVSFVNPHDIAWYYRATDPLPAYANAPRLATALPANFETPADQAARNKPRLQRAHMARADRDVGVMPFEGDGFESRWLQMLDVYLQIQRHVDVQIGRVLDALAQHPAAARTIVVFTSDHGEYAGSHGLRSKGRAVYEESIRVPFYVKDPTGQFAANPEIERTQLTSHVDLTPLMLTLAYGDNSWRTAPELAHLARRLDMAAILRDPAAPGRPYILHTYEDHSIDAPTPLPPELTNVPQHVIGYRTRLTKLGIYSYWAPDSLDILTEGQESELYDYRTQMGRLELNNAATTQPGIYNPLYTALQQAIQRDLRAPLPAYLQPAQQAGVESYLTFIRTHPSRQV